MSLNYIKQHNKDIRDFLEKSFVYSQYLSKQKLEKRNCPVCGSTNSYRSLNNGYFDYCRCTACDHLFMNPVIDPQKLVDGFQGNDDLMTDYFAIMSKYKTDIPPKPDPLADNKLVDIYQIKQFGKLLDVGCAFGNFMHKARYFYDVEGVEVNPHTAAVAEKYFTVHKKFLSELNLKKEYDIVVLHEILYGTFNPISLLTDIRKILKDDGILYIHTGNSDSYAMDLYKGKTNHLHVYTMLNVFNRKSLTKLAELTGFRLKTFRTEWLDIYISDLLLFLRNDPEFIHKKNIQILDYEEKLGKEDEMHKSLDLDLGDKGNYIVAVLEKK